MAMLLKLALIQVVIISIFHNTHEGLAQAIKDRIIGGRMANEGEFPYQVSIRRSYNDAHFCGGALISYKHTMSAAHCMFYVWGGLLPPIIVSVFAGQVNLTDIAEAVYRNASQIFVHPQFDKKLFTNDIAVIELSSNFPGNNKLISVIPMRTQSLLSATSCVISGWGVQNVSSGESSNLLLTTVVKIVEYSTCVDVYKAIDIILSDGMICAGDDEKQSDACQGDSGGPLVCEGELTGVISSGKGCGDINFPGIYTNISHFLRWIEHIISPETETTTSNRIINDNLTSTYFTENIITTIFQHSANSSSTSRNLIEWTSILLCIFFFTFLILPIN